MGEGWTPLPLQFSAQAGPNADSDDEDGDDDGGDGVRRHHHHHHMTPIGIL